MRILKPNTEVEVNWIAEAHEEVGRMSIRNYRKTRTSFRDAAQQIKNWLKDESYRILVAYDDPTNRSTPVGMLVCGIRKSPLDGELEAFIESVYVEPAMREKGLGQRLIKEACMWGVEKGAKRVKALVSSTNTNMVRLCKKLGYQESFVILEKDIYENCLRETYNLEKNNLTTA